MPRLTIVLLLGALLLGACGSPQPQDCARPEVFCAGLVTDFGPVDSGIQHEAWLGLQDAKAANLVNRIDVIETVDTRDRAINIQTLAEKGYDVIVTVGPGISKETTAAAAEYPKLDFVGVEQTLPSGKLANLATLVFPDEYGGFMAGALAGLVTQTGRVAAVCEANYIESMQRYCEAFKLGAQYARPGVAADVVYRDGPTEKLFNDPDWGRKTALQQVQDGADVIFAAGGETADAALQAAAAEGAYVIGSEADLYPTLALIRPRLLTSATNDIRSAIVEILTSTRRGKFPPGEFKGNVELAPWHDLDRQIPPDVKNQVEIIGVRLKLGILTAIPPVPVTPPPAVTATPEPP